MLLLSGFYVIDLSFGFSGFIRFFSGFWVNALLLLMYCCLHVLLKSIMIYILFVVVLCA